MSYSIVVVEDEKPARMLLESYVQKVPEGDCVMSFANPIQAKTFLDNHKVDILLLDIQMDDLTGLDLLRMLDQPPVTILTTAYSEYALEGYELEVIDYLLKPISFQRFFKAVSKAMGLVELRKKGKGMDSLALDGEVSGFNVNKSVALPDTPSSSDEDFFFVKTNRKIVKVNYGDVIFVESYGEYIKIHTEEKTLMVLQRMSSMEQQMPDGRFFRIHRSHLVNLSKIQEIDGNIVKVRGHELIVSKRLKEEFLKTIRKKGLLG